MGLLKRFVNRVYDDRGRCSHTRDDGELQEAWISFESQYQYSIFL